MENINRSKAPEYKVVDQIQILESKKNKLQNGIDIYSINGGSQDIAKIDLIFEAGIWYQKRPIISAMCNAMLNEGTSKYSAQEIAEKFDFYGAYIDFSTGQKTSSVTLYTLNKHLKDTLSLLKEVITDSAFPAKEFNTILKNKKQNFILSREKTSSLAREQFMSNMYGEKHVITNKLDPEDFDTLKLQDVKEFYTNHYNAQNCYIIAAGKINDSTLALVNDLFGKEDWKNQNKPTIKETKVETATKKNVSIIKKDAVQTAIRIGRPLFNKTHPDYIGMQVLNTVLGGYFGSRLMTNIREDKGYTYGIGSMIVGFEKNIGHLTIVTEVGAEVSKDAIKEIFIELKNLRETPVSYTNKYYKDYISKCKKISAQDIQNLAIKYLQDEDLHIIVAGPEQLY